VAKACGLVPTGVVEVHTVGGKQTVNKYLVNVTLPNHLCCVGVPVAEGKVFGADVLIGMDIITQGDFAVTNKGGKTMFSFRYPSKEHIDFVWRGQRQSQPRRPTHPRKKRSKKSRR